MGFPVIGMLSTGLSLFGGISGLLSSADAEHQAEVAAQNAIRDYKASASQEQLNLLGGGTAGLENLSGGLNNALVANGRSLGAALAGTGVSNSTAAAGAIANQAGQDASVEGKYSSGLAAELLEQQNQTNSEAAQMSFGLATNNLNYARQQSAGATSGLGQLFGNLGQMNFGNLFGHTGGAANTAAPQTSSVLPATNGMVIPAQNQFQGGGLGNATNWGGY